MKKAHILILFTFTLALRLAAQNNIVEISSKINDSKTGEPLIGVSVVIKSTLNGTITDTDGRFKLRTKLVYPFTLVVSYLGYEAQEFTVENPDQALIINLNPQSIVTNDVVVTASRIEEDILKSPVAIEKLDIRALRETPAPSFYDALENVKGVQMTTSSLTFKVPNTRGFNIPNNFRFMQVVDGVDMQAATLGVPLGNAIGPTELDIESVEITPGASSALYGMNAINGMSNLISKSPFRYQGLSIYQKVGVNHIDGKDRPVSPLSETAFRYAKAFNNKLAFKANFSYFKGTDWVSSNETDQNAYTLSNPKYPQFGSGVATNPAYDGWNIYGNENNNNVTIKPTIDGKIQTLNIRRTGYEEKDLTERFVQNVKFDGALHYRFTEKLEASYSYRIGSMDGTFQRGNKIRLNNVMVQNHKIELKSPDFSVRAYASLENTGNSYNLKPLSDNLDLTHLSNSAWGKKFNTEFQNETNSGVDINTALINARGVADQGRVLPGTAEFNNLKNTIVNINNWDHVANVTSTSNNTGGAALWQKSNMYHADGQYDFSKYTKNIVDVLVGADARIYEVIPDGNNFVDFSKPLNERTTPGGNNVYYSKVGGFVQATKRLFNDNLKIVGSLRYDKNMEFEGKWNPRIALIYTLNKYHNFRASVQNGWRFPSLFEALSFVNNGNVRRVGGLARINDGLGYLENSYTQASVDAFNNAVNADPLSAADANQAAINQQDVLVKSDLKATQPENINSFELGYKSVLFENRFVVDVDIYFNEYRGFLGQVEVAVPTSGKVGSDEAAADMLNTNRTEQTRYRVFTNAKNTSRNYGSALRLSYYITSKWNISGNAGYNDIVTNKTSDVFVTGFNTPKYNALLSIGNREVFKNFGFNVVWKWQDSFLWESPLANGSVPSFNTFDAQINYRVPKIFATAKLGASNVFNQRYIQYAGGPTIGALYYLSLTFDGLLAGKAN